MARRQTGVRERLAAQLDSLEAWSAAPERPDAAARLRLDARRAQAARPASDDELLIVEAGLMADAAALADERPADPPPLARAALAGAVRSTLAVLAARRPGHLVEVRVPPHGAVQIGVRGVASVHKRGTPPNVIETDAVTWLRLAAGSLPWADAVAARRVSASGVHAQLDDLRGA